MHAFRDVNVISGLRPCMRDFTHRSTAGFSSQKRIWVRGQGNECITAHNPVLVTSHSDLVTVRRIDGMAYCQGLRSLSDLVLSECYLSTVPEVLSDLSALTFLDLSGNCFDSPDPHWWPTSMSR
jgi:hypothetical protein